MPPTGPHHDGDFFTTQAFRRTATIHGRVTATQNDNALSDPVDMTEGDRRQRGVAQRRERFFGVEAVAGILAGSLVAGGVLAIASSNSGGAWDNAKKYIEAGNLGGKGSEEHKAAVVGDTVGDPLKDTSGPSLNILIKLSAILSLVFAPFFVQYGGILL